MYIKPAQNGFQRFCEYYHLTAMPANENTLRLYVKEYCDDDGEYGGGSIILKVMKDQNITGRVVVVTRRASGVHLGHRRWDIITQCAKEVVS